MTKEGIDLIKKFEGCKLSAYKCPAGIWTIGYGHINSVYQGQTITQYEADKMLENDVVKFEMGVRNLVGNLPDNKIDALTSFAFNLGLGSLRDSTLCKKVKANADMKEICLEFMKWVNAGGRLLEGLVARRHAEAEMFSGQKIKLYRNKGNKKVDDIEFL
jgi:lysozyme